MPKLAAAFASSHSVMLTCTLEDWQRGFLERDPHGQYYDRQGNLCTYADLLALAPADASERVSAPATARRYADVRGAIERLRRDIAAARLDALIVCGDDQHELFDETHMPSIGVYYGSTIRNAARPKASADWYKRAQLERLEPETERHYPCDDALALHLIEGLMARDFDLTTLSGLPAGKYEGHAFSFIHRTYLAAVPVPIVPVFLNTFYPPNQPSPARCLALGTAIRDIVAAYPREMRFGLIASGGLSHFQAEEDLDRAVIAAVQEKDAPALASLDPRRLQSGSSEIRNWIVLAGAAGDLELDWVSYTPGYRTPALTGTGLAFAAWRPR